MLLKPMLSEIIVLLVVHGHSTAKVVQVDTLRSLVTPCPEQTFRLRFG